MNEYEADHFDHHEPEPEDRTSDAELFERDQLAQDRDIEEADLEIIEPEDTQVRSLYSPVFERDETTRQLAAAVRSLWNFTKESGALIESVASLEARADSATDDLLDTQQRISTHAEWIHCVQQRADALQDQGAELWIAVGEIRIALTQAAAHRDRIANFVQGFEDLPRRMAAVEAHIKWTHDFADDANRHFAALEERVYNIERGNSGSRSEEE